MPSLYTETENDLMAAAQAALLESFPDAAALIDHQGRVLGLNAAWRELGANTIWLESGLSVGGNYLELWETAVGEWAASAVRAAEGLRAVLGRRVGRFEMQYSVQAPSRKLWLHLVVTPISIGSQDGAMVIHHEVTQAHENAERLKENQALLQCASRASRLGAWRLDFTGPVVTWSDSARAIYEVPADYLPTLEEAFCLHPPEYRDTLRQMVLSCQQDGRAFDLIVEAQTPSGRRLWVRVTGEAVRGGDGRVCQLVGGVQDIDASQRTHIELQRTMDRLSATLESMSDGFMFVDHDWVITNVNAAGEKMVRVARQDQIGRKLLDVFPEIRDSPFWSAYQRAVASRQPQRVEHFYAPLATWFELQAYPTTEGLGLYFRDITERKRTEQQLLEQAARLQESEQEYRRLFATNPQPMWVFDEDTLRFLAVNAAAVFHYGYTEDEFLAMTLYDIRLPEEVAAMKEEMERPQTRPSGRMGQFRHRRKDGRIIDVEVSSSPIDTFAGKPARIVSIHDVTGKVQAEREARRAQRMESVGTLAGGIAHDLNNLLSPIALGIGLLREQLRDRESLESIATMERNAKRAAAVVGQLLTFANGAEGSLVPMRIQDVVGEVAEIVQSTFPKNIHLAVRHSPSLWPALADATQVHQVLLNLCLNARDALPNGGRVEIVTSNAEIDEHFSRMHRDLAPGRFVLIEVIDNGAGIEPEILDRIFEPFFTTKPVQQGSGLGLSNVLGIVRGHGGCVGVASKPGKGSTFKVYLPVAPGAELPAGNPSPSLTRGRGELILLVDDELAILEITAKALRAFGYKVLIAEDGARAVGLYAMHHAEVKLVLTDMMMPGMDGAALIATLLRMNPALRVIASSGHNAADNAQSALEAGAVSFLAKPYSAEAMLRAIAETVGRAA